MTPVATADVSGGDGAISGTVMLYDAPEGALAKVELSGVPEGVHGIHLHETGDCSASDFTSAGGHIAGDREHGFLVEGGPHPGDMPNVTVGSDGGLTVDAFLPHLDLDGMIGDEDGAAFILHAGADDYTSQPSGDAGSRLACGVFEMSGG
jgi:Cu-Zn family superoxide dismutase